MKEAFCLFSFAFIYVFSLGQNNDLQAQYLFSKAEDSYLKEQFSDAISLCDQAAEKLGQTNQKILFLELKSYAGLLAQKCDDPLLNNKIKIDICLDLYLNKLSQGVDNEKIITIMKFKDQWTDYKVNGCPAPTYADLHLGLSFRDGDHQELFGKGIKRFWEVTIIGNGPLKNITGTSHKFTSNWYSGKTKTKEIEARALSVGFLVDEIYLRLSSPSSTGLYLYSSGDNYHSASSELILISDGSYKYYYNVVSSTEIETMVYTWLKMETASKHKSDKIHAYLSGHYPTDRDSSTLYSVDLLLSK